MCDKIFQLLPQAYVVSTVYSTPGSGSRSCRGCPRRPMSSPLSSRPRKVSLRSCERLPPQACVVPPVFSTPGSGSRSCRGCPLAVFFLSAFLVQKGFQDLDRLANLNYFLQAAPAHPLPGLDSSSSAQAVAPRPRPCLGLSGDCPGWS